MYRDSRRYSHARSVTVQQEYLLTATFANDPRRSLLQVYISPQRNALNSIINTRSLYDICYREQQICPNTLVLGWVCFLRRVMRILITLTCLYSKPFCLKSGTEITQTHIPNKLLCEINMHYKKQILQIASKLDNFTRSTLNFACVGCIFGPSSLWNGDWSMLQPNWQHLFLKIRQVQTITRNRHQ